MLVPYFPNKNNIIPTSTADNNVVNNKLPIDADSFPNNVIINKIGTTAIS